MASKSTISFLRSLQLKKFRHQEGLFVVEGPKLVSDLLKSDFKVRQLYALSEWERPSGLNTEVEIISPSEMERVSSMQTPNKVMAVVEMPDLTGPVPALQEGLHLLLDQIQDPGNLGTIIRIADWFGVSSIICSMDTADLFNPKVLQATMGSVFHTNIYYSSIADVLLNNANSKRWPVYATKLNGEKNEEQNRFNISFTSNYCNDSNTNFCYRS